MAALFKKSGGSRRQSSIGDRIVQIILLVLVAWGIFSAARIATDALGGSDESAAYGSMGGAPGSGGGAPAGGPGGGMPGGSSQDSSDEAAIAVETTRAARGTVAELIRINGDVVASRSTTVYPDVSGDLVAVQVEVGSTVAAGDQIATVDPSVPGERYTNSAVLSPVAGTVTETNADTGDTVSASTAIAVVADLSRLQVEINVPERFVATIRPGMRAELTVPAYPEATFAAVVHRVSPVIDAETRTLATTLLIQDGRGLVRAGMFASVRLQTDVATDVVTVPAVALQDYYEQEIVWVVADDGTVARREVTVGLRSDDLLEIEAGIDAGEEIVVAGRSNLTEGAAVQIVNVGGEE